MTTILAMTMTMTMTMPLTMTKALFFMLRNPVHTATNPGQLPKTGLSRISHPLYMQHGPCSPPEQSAR
eukprot:1421383-Lingulodinium_polyedra.AAC.1